jgi:hypothetical protein
MLMKKLILILLFSIVITSQARGQLKEALQLATLSPTLVVVTHSDIINAHKLHYTLSTLGYISAYMVTDSYWKAAVITLAAGVAKELLYDGLLGKGEPLWEDMKWNALGTVQGAVFTVSLRF